MNPTKTVHMVYYRATDGSGYQWSEQALTRELGQETLEQGVGVTRRVLNIPGEHTYITVGPERTAKNYTTRLRQKYIKCSGYGWKYIFSLKEGLQKNITKDYKDLEADMKHE